MYLILGIIFLILSLVVFGYLLFTIIRSVKLDKEFISKKNLTYLMPAFALMYGLNIIATVYNGTKMTLFSCLALVRTTLDVFVFKISTSLIDGICAEYPIFYADFAIATVTSVAATILGVCAFFSIKIRNSFYVRRLLRKSCDIVIGDSPDSVKYIKNNKNSILLGTKLTRQRYEELLKSGVPVLRSPLGGKNVIRRLKKYEHHLIVFRDTNQPYTGLIRTFNEIRESGANCVHLHLEGNAEEIKVIREKFISQADKNSAPFITCFGKYELMARAFVTDYPITKFIPRDFYNDNYSLKENKEIKVVFIGFGKVNYQLLRTFAMQFQFAYEKDGEFVSAPVNYYIYDNNNARLNNDLFSRLLFEFDDIFADTDFPKPDKICNIYTFKSDINSVEVRQQLKDYVTEDSFTYFVVSIDEDLSDASYAKTISRLLADKKNYQIFVRAKNYCGEILNKSDDPVIYFGDDQSIYSHDCIVNDDLTEMSMRLNLLYNQINDSSEWVQKIRNLPAELQSDALETELSDTEHRNEMIKGWSNLQLIEQESNIYHVLNMPFKLHLLGFDMVKKIEDTAVIVTEEEFDKVYVNPGRENNYNNYKFFFECNSSNLLAFIEHARWNALYILYDYTQMKKKDMALKEIKLENGLCVTELPHKDAKLKKHACLTTYYGLYDLILYKYRILSSESNHEIDVTDPKFRDLTKIYVYDYMSLDRLYSELKTMEYSIVKYCNSRENMIN